jgi:hypothetical protein
MISFDMYKPELSLGESKSLDSFIITHLIEILILPLLKTQELAQFQ